MKRYRIRVVAVSNHEIKGRIQRFDLVVVRVHKVSVGKWFFVLSYKIKVWGLLVCVKILQLAPLHELVFELIRLLLHVIWLIVIDLESVNEFKQIHVVCVGAVKCRQREIVESGCTCLY